MNRLRGFAGRVSAPLVVALLAFAIAGSANAESSSITASVRVAPIDVALVLSGSSARVGDKIRAQATVTNLGTSQLTGISVELRVDSTGLAIRGSAVTTISRLKSGASVSSTWTLCAVQPGNYLVMAHATAADGVAVDSAARLLSISGTRHGGCT
jgi:hypothetical protein